MANYTKISFNVPDVNQSFKSGNYKYSAPETIVANKKIIQDIKSNLGALISKWGSEFEIDNEILISFIATESGNTNAPPNQFEATGYMQVTPTTVYETITKWDSTVGSPLPANLKSILAKNIPSYKNWNASVLPSTAVKSQIKSALKNPEFNIAMGSAVIRWLLEAYSKDSNSPLNKAMASYNIGYYGAKSKLKGNLTSTQIINIKGLGAEAKGYLVKMLGRNGFLELQLNK